MPILRKPVWFPIVTVTTIAGWYFGTPVYIWATGRTHAPLNSGTPLSVNEQVVLPIGSMVVGAGVGFLIALLVEMAFARVERR